MIVNLFAGPGAGKSTTAAGLFALLKKRGKKCELAHEWIKYPVYAERVDLPQFYVWAKQQKLIDMLEEKVDIVITDSPTALSLVYAPADCNWSFPFFDLVLAKFKEKNNLNVFLERLKPYADYGRTQTEEEAHVLDTKIHNMLHNYNLVHVHVWADGDAPIDIVTLLTQEGLE